MGRKRGRNDDPAPSSTAPPVALAAGRGAPVEAPDVVLPEVWCYGVDALSSGCCGRLAACSKGFYLAVRKAVAERITLGLAEGCVQADLASTRLQNPILALSHLESLAHSQFLFGGIRALLRYMASICLLESPPCPDALCDLLLSQLRGDDDGSDGSAASAWARLAALVYHYQPPRTWQPPVESLLRRGAKRRSTKAATLAPLAAKGGELGQLLHGMPAVQPYTKTCKNLAIGKLNLTKLICQLLERLVFPPQQTSLLLHLALPAAAALDADAAQPPCFVQNLRVLEAEVWKEGDGMVDILVLDAKKSYYVMFVEGLDTS
ncbi:unnamed protein product [Cladocopium goreaui]|uniref:Right handed beta helix domain-containing protein n=1 Tax=Cladocopium goreaui TaxID=2562237 RepID=A0A9P1FHE2_9DINO|nr:unnamed protein product [Cladocopium goreaui]